MKEGLMGIFLGATESDFPLIHLRQLTANGHDRSQLTLTLPSRNLSLQHWNVVKVLTTHAHAMLFGEKGIRRDTSNRFIDLTWTVTAMYYALLSRNAVMIQLRSVV